MAWVEASDPFTLDKFSPHKQALRLAKQEHDFLYICLPSMHEYDVKLGNFTFYENVNIRRRISISLF